MLLDIDGLKNGVLVKVKLECTTFINGRFVGEIQPITGAPGRSSATAQPISSLRLTMSWLTIYGHFLQRRYKPNVTEDTNLM